LSKAFGLGWRTLTKRGFRLKRSTLGKSPWP